MTLYWIQRESQEINGFAEKNQDLEMEVLQDFLIVMITGRLLFKNSLKRLVLVE